MLLVTYQFKITAFITPHIPYHFISPPPQSAKRINRLNVLDTIPLVIFGVEHRL
jgi:hypothetical protein